MSEYHHLSTSELFQALESQPEGLTGQEALKRLRKYGPNEIIKGKRLSVLVILIDQFKNALILLLVFAGILSLILGEILESTAMFSIVILNVILGFVEEYRADKVMEALAKRAALEAKVLRNGEEQKIPASEVVPGDVILLEAGDVVSADARLIEISNYLADEASLTGESVPSEKNTQPGEKNLPFTDQLNMTFMGTVATYGKAKAIVTKTGMDTEFGKISSSLSETGEVQTPLQVTFSKLANQIGKIAVVLITLVFIAGTILGGLSVVEMLIVALALAVATIPAALPTVVTVGLAMGSKTLARKKMLIRKLPAAESLGAATIICSDKTGTMTKNEMTVSYLFTDRKIISVRGSESATGGNFTMEGKAISSEELDLLLRIGFLCNNAKFIQNNGRTELLGDPTEGALLVLGMKGNLTEESLKEHFQLIQELPFDSERKRMSVVYKNNHNHKIESYVKGAPDILLGLCDRIHIHGEIQPLTAEMKEEILQTNNQFGQQALRVIALAYGELPEAFSYEIDSVEKNLVFIGLAGMIDPPRDEVKEAVQKCQQAGIGVMMITGDHAVTAKAIGEQIGVYRDGDLVLTGSEISQWSKKDLETKIEHVKIVARALPIQKLSIVEALQKGGHIVAMTGDGINDAPALKKADIGIAMGMSGTDVSRQASKAVLIDDNFASIVKAIAEGRNIYDKMIKTAKYLLSCNIGEVFTILVAILIQLPLPLVPLQILMINLLTDALPALGLGLESAEPGVMERKPRDPDEKPISGQLFFSIVFMGIIMGTGTLFMFVQYIDIDLKKAQTVAFTTLVMVQLFAVMSSRSLHPSLQKLNPFSNLWLLGGIALSVLLHISVVYWPPLQLIFNTTDLSMTDWAKILGVSSVGFIIMEISKFSFKALSKSST